MARDKVKLEPLGVSPSTGAVDDPEPVKTVRAIAKRLLRPHAQTCDLKHESKHRRWNPEYAVCITHMLYRCAILLIACKVCIAGSCCEVALSESTGPLLGKLRSS